MQLLSPAADAVARSPTVFGTLKTPESESDLTDSDTLTLRVSVSVITQSQSQSVTESQDSGRSLTAGESLSQGSAGAQPFSEPRTASPKDFVKSDSMSPPAPGA
jgi:hypothetical protein